MSKQTRRCKFDKISLAACKSQENPVFFDELSPLIGIFRTEPTAFCGGFLAGAFRLDPEEEPLRGWLVREISLERNPEATHTVTNAPDAAAKPSGRDR